MQKPKLCQDCIVASLATVKPVTKHAATKTGCSHSIICEALVLLVQAGAGVVLPIPGIGRGRGQGGRGGPIKTFVPQAPGSTAAATLSG